MVNTNQLIIITDSKQSQVSEKYWKQQELGRVRGQGTRT